MSIKIAFDKSQYPKLSLTPHDGAMAADASLQAYQKWDGAKDPGILLVNFLVDLMHWSTTHGVDFDPALNDAKKYYTLDCDDYEENKRAIADSGGPGQ